MQAATNPLTTSAGVEAAAAGRQHEPSRKEKTMDLEIEAPIDDLDAIEYDSDAELLGDASVITCIPARCTSGVR